MTKYKVTNLVVKQGKSGKNYYQADFTDESGTTVSATTFDVLTENNSYEGEITTNGQYTNFKVKIENNGNFAPNTGRLTGVKAAQERKAEFIEKAQEVRATGVEISATFRDATSITIAQFNGKDFTTEEFQNVWTYWRKWLIANYDPGQNKRELGF